MDAQGALDSLLGRLTTILVDEAQLLGGVRGDVEHIKEEMECMNGLILHLTEAQHRSDHVRAWMKQVTGFTRDCEGNVELYIHYVGGGTGDKGFFGFLCRIPRFLRTIRLRHRVASQIRELKARAQDVGDRRLRYGITVPESSMNADNDVENPWPDEWRCFHRNLRIQRDAFDDRLEKDSDDQKKKGIDSLVQWLSDEPPPPAVSEPRVRLFAVTGTEAYDVADEAFNSVERLFNGTKHIFYCNQDGQVVLKEALPLSENEDESLKGKRHLIILYYPNTTREELHAALCTLLRNGCHHGSAIGIITENCDMAKSLSPDKIIHCDKYANIVHLKAQGMNSFLQEQHRASYCKIIDLIYHDVFAMKMFMHLLYPSSTSHEMEKYQKIIEECKQSGKSIAQQMIMCCYNKLPTKYRSCLLYVAMFPISHNFRAKSLSRRWIAEGLISSNTTSDGTENAKNEAALYLDVLVNRGFLDPVEISGRGNIKTFTVHPEVYNFISKTARDVNFVDTDLPINLACHLSCHSRIGLQESHSDEIEKKESHSDDGIQPIVGFLPTMAASPQWQMLKVLDLGGCSGLKKKHLNNICMILLLKYLSLRNTDVTKLPKQIENLQRLETLDIRQTAIRAFSTKSIRLPMLKYLLAGHKISQSNKSDRFEETFVAVHLTSGVRKMKKLEILSHVEVSDIVDNLVDIGQLMQLKKLGVILHGKKGGLSLLFQQIEKLHGCLRSLSVRINQPVRSENAPDANSKVVSALKSPPKLLESISISGIAGGLPCWITQLPQLAKVTLRETFLGEDAITILGELRMLRCLRLLHKSYNGSKLSFKKNDFGCLVSLVVEGSDITDVSFDTGTAFGLERIVWSFDTMKDLSGINNLKRLKKIELNGDCHNLDQIKAALEKHHNRPELKHNPVHQRQEEGTAAADSSSSAP